MDVQSDSREERPIVANLLASARERPLLNREVGHFSEIATYRELVAFHCACVA